MLRLVDPLSMPAHRSCYSRLSTIPRFHGFQTEGKGFSIIKHSQIQHDYWIELKEKPYKIKSILNKCIISNDSTTELYKHHRSGKITTINTKEAFNSQREDGRGQRQHKAWLTQGGGDQEMLVHSMTGRTVRRLEFNILLGLSRSNLPTKWQWKERDTEQSRLRIHRFSESQNNKRSTSRAGSWFPASNQSPGSWRLIGYHQRFRKLNTGLYFPLCTDMSGIRIHNRTHRTRFSLIRY